MIIGGLSGLARRRAIRTAQGWFAYNTTVDWTRDILDVIAKETAEIGRPTELGPLELTIIPAGPFDRSIADQYAELGVDRVVRSAATRCADRYTAHARSVRRDPPHDRHDRRGDRPLSRDRYGEILAMG